MRRVRLSCVDKYRCGVLEIGNYLVELYSHSFHLMHSFTRHARGRKEKRRYIISNTAIEYMNDLKETDTAFNSTTEIENT